MGGWVEISMGEWMGVDGMGWLNIWMGGLTYVHTHMCCALNFPLVLGTTLLFTNVYIYDVH